MVGASPGAGERAGPERRHAGGRWQGYFCWTLMDNFE